MKTNRYFTILAAAALAFSACSSDDLVNDQLVDPQQPTEGETIGFTGNIANGLYMEDDDASTRVGIDGSNITAWYQGDKISVSDGTLNYTYSVKQTTQGSSCSFESITSSEFTTDGTGSSENTFLAFYPAAAVLGWDGSKVSTMVYTEQDYAENKEQSTAENPFGPYLAAKATTTNNGKDANFTFLPICSVIDVDLSTFASVTGVSGSTKVVSVSIYARNQKSIAGKMSYTFANEAGEHYGTISVTDNDGTGYSYSTQSETVTVGNINKTLTELASDGIVRFYVLPIKITGGVVVTVRLDDGTYYSKTTTTNVGTGTTPTGFSVSGVTDGEVCQPYYKKYNSSNFTLTNNWMGTIPGNVKFNFLSIPGAHQAGTKDCTAYGTTTWTKCQSFSIADLLSKGCRALDLRAYYDSSTLELYHASYSCGVTLGDAFSACRTFLSNHPTETVFLLIHQEEGSSGNSNWMNRVWTLLNDYTDIIASGGWRGNLNPCRGKMVVIFRDDYAKGTNTADLGCGKVGWGDNEIVNGKSIYFGNSSANYDDYWLYFQDKYDTSNANTKMTNLTTALNHIANNETDATRTYVNNMNIASGTSSIGSLCSAVHDKVLDSNSAFINHTGRFGIMMFDYMFVSDHRGDEMYDLVRNQNYTYVYKNRTRCTTTSSGGSDSGVDVATDEYADDSQVYSRKH